MQTLLLIFWNPTQHRMRAGWRILIHGVAYFLGFILSTNFILSQFQGIPAMILYPLVLFLVALLVLWLAGRFLDKRSFADFGFHFNRGWWLDLGFGLALGAVLMALVFWIERAAGWVTVTGMYHTRMDAAFWPALLFGLWHFIEVGINEECFSRGYQLRNMAEGFNFARVGPKNALLLAYIISSSLFGLLHIFNPNATLVSSVLIMGAGFLLGLGYVLTGELAVPIGLHITWNFFQGNVFGFPVSGSTPGATLLVIEQGGPLLWTGGEFGPEAGLIGLAAMLLGLLLTLLWVRWRKGTLRLEDRLAVYLPGAQVQSEPLPLETTAS